MYSSSIIDHLKAQGFKMTKVRQELVDILSSVKQPISVTELINWLDKRGLKANKSTVYRELDFLKLQKVLTEIQFNEDKKRYEIASSHHHHLICLRCDRIEDVGVEGDLDHYEADITKSKNFQVLNHSLEFFGMCQQCQ